MLSQSYSYSKMVTADQGAAYAVILAGATHVAFIMDFYCLDQTRRRENEVKGSPSVVGSLVGGGNKH